MSDAAGLASVLATLGPEDGTLPWPRYRLDRESWRGLIARLATVDWSLVALWGEEKTVQLALRDEVAGTQALARLDCPEGSYPSLAAVRPGAIRLERAIRDLHGLDAEGAADTRPWLDHGRWGAISRLIAAAPYPFLPVEGEGVHQIPVGPVHAGIIEPGHFRFHANGETVVRLEERLGYVHKGTERLMQGKTALEAARLAGRLSGDATVAYAIAFARAVEAALGVEPPPRAVYLRALMAELERIANHFGDFGAICNDAAFGFIQAHATVAREGVLRAAETCFGHRLMMDRVVPGGVAVDLAEAAGPRVALLMTELADSLAYLMRIYDNKPSLQDRTVSTGVALSELVHRFAAGGFVGRASGRAVDARKSPGYPPYDDLDFDIPTRSEGDVHARLMIRIEELKQSFRLVEQLLERMPQGEIRRELPSAVGGGGSGEGIAEVESFRGDVFVYVKLDGEGRVIRCHPRDPSWFQWPLLEACVENNIVADFPLCNKSFNCSYSGHDL
ncbi:MAG: nickel-dependent hydrogenase large subunit [Proteobacteria bacterium]|nr:nickel-dependent hydrogenase large subunit [Pseudomonadota bacterium]MBI3496421.1 nickel-dependent hydrogenase large subunit [Pseudomonadota bacterium]